MRKPPAGDPPRVYIILLYTRIGRRGKVLCGGGGRGTGRPNPNIMVGDTIWFFVLNNISSGLRLALRRRRRV